ncbi:hypothetical protein DYB26_007102, partial [Aphanomyces astaci]
YAGEIVDPKRTYPRAMVLTVILIALTYLIPFVAITGVDKPHYATWVDGSYTSIALGVGGMWLCGWVVVSNFFGNLGLYMAEMTKDGFQLAGMADSGLAPGGRPSNTLRIHTPMSLPGRLALATMVEYEICCPTSKWLSWHASKRENDTNESASSDVNVPVTCKTRYVPHEDGDGSTHLCGKHLQSRMWIESSGC